MPGCGASGVGRSHTPDHSFFWGVRPGARYPLAVGALWGRGGPAVLGTLSCAAVRRVLSALPGFAARGGRWSLVPVFVLLLWPVACLFAVHRGPALVRCPSSGPVALGAPVGLPADVLPSPTLGATPRLYSVTARGTWSPAENRAHCACRWPLPRQRRWARYVSYPFGATRWGCPWRVPPASVLGCVRCGSLACVDPVTDASRFPYRPFFDRGLGRCTGAASYGRRHLPFRVGGRHACVPRVCLCVLSLAASGSLASWAHSGAPHLVLWPFCAPSLLGPLRAAVACASGFFSFFLSFFFPLSSLPPSRAPAVSAFLCLPAPGALGLGALCFSSAPPRRPGFFLLCFLGVFAPRQCMSNATAYTHGNLFDAVNHITKTVCSAIPRLKGRNWCDLWD